MGIIFNPEIKAIDESHVLTDNRRIKRPIKMGVMASPDPGRNFGTKAYFKCFDAPSYEDARKLTRICFLKPEYGKKHTTKGKTDFILTVNDTKDLLTILQQPCNNHKGASEGLLNPWLNWHELIYCFDAILNFTHQEIVSISTADKEVLEQTNTRFMNFIPLDTPIPDYTKL